MASFISSGFVSSVTVAAASVDYSGLSPDSWTFISESDVSVTPTPSASADDGVVTVIVTSYSGGDGYIPITSTINPADGIGATPVSSGFIAATGVSSTNHSSSNTKAIAIGASIGGVAALGLLVAGFIFYQRRKERKSFARKTEVLEQRVRDGEMAEYQA